VLTKQIQSGQGWRVGWRWDRAQFCVLLAGEHWSFEVTRAELHTINDLAQQLAATMQVMEAELADTEKIRCEAAADGVRLEVFGFPSAYNLQVQILTMRNCEGIWSEAIVPEVLAALQQADIALKSHSCGSIHENKIGLTQNPNCPHPPTPSPRAGERE
jgi:hypothetical protein